MRYSFGIMGTEFIASHSGREILVELYVRTMPKGRELDLFLNRREGTEYVTVSLNHEGAQIQNVNADFPCTELALLSTMPDIRRHLESYNYAAFIPALEKIVQPNSNPAMRQ